MNLKGLAYEIDPLIPFYGNERFSQLSPLRRIPVLVDGDTVLCDSSVVFQYLEAKYPEPALLPVDPERKAKALWLEEYADTRMGDVIIWQLYNQLVIGRFVWGKAPDEEVLRQTREEDLPGVLNYLEAWAPAEGFLFGDLSIADITAGCFFKNAAFARYTVDATRWPKTAALLEKVFALNAFQNLAPFEMLCLKTPIAKHREALMEAGAPVSQESYWTDKPVPGVMTVK